MKIHIENFGPIKDAKIEPTTLNIIIGKNNQGKSYSAELIFSLLQLKRILESTVPSSLRVQFNEKKDKITLSIVTRQLSKISTTTRNGAHGVPATLTFRLQDLKLSTEQFAEKLIMLTLPLFTKLTGIFLPLLLEEQFGVKLQELVNANFENAKLTVDLSRFIQISFTIFKNGKTAVEASFNEDMLPKLREALVPSVGQMKTQLRKSFDLKIPESRRMPPFETFETIINIIHTLASGSWQDFRHSYGLHTSSRDLIYIPAGRAGLLEGYYSVSSAYFSLATVAVPRSVIMPAMPSTASIFYNLFLEFSGRETTMGEVASQLAKDVLRGEIVLQPDNRQPALKKIIYRFPVGNEKNIDIDVIHAGSMVKELAGLYLAIKERITPETQLIFEEPEAHLHPNAQKKIAGVLMNLASKGVRVTVTTHSDIILREVAHIIGKSAYDKTKKSVPPSRVSVVLLKEGEKGSISEEIIIPRTGILEGIPTFDEVILQLYKDETDLQSGISE